MTMDEKPATGRRQGTGAGGKGKRKCHTGNMKPFGRTDKGSLEAMYSTVEAPINAVKKSLFCTKSGRKPWIDVVNDGVDGETLHQPFELLG